MSDDRHLPDEEEAPPERWPVGFILILVAAALYLGYRLFQGIDLFLDWIR